MLGVGTIYNDKNFLFSRSQISFTEESTFATARPHESASILDSTETNPYRKFLIGETFSIQSNSLMDQQNTNAHQFQSVYARIFNSIKLDTVDSKSMYGCKKPDQSPLNDTLIDDDDMSSGCDSGACSDSGEELTLADVADVSDSNVTDIVVNEKKEFINAEEYVDDFNDNFSNEILNKLPAGGLRELVAQIRETTNAEIRQRNKDARVIMMLTADDRLGRRKLDVRSRVFCQSPASEVATSPLQHSHYPNGNLKSSFKIFPWKKKQPSAEDSNNSAEDSNFMVVDNTNVTLRRKGTSQINEDESPNVTSSMEDNQIPPAQPETFNEPRDVDVDELVEFNALNFWKEDIGTFDIDKELDLLKERELKEARGNAHR